jgi:hypothetical protein
MTCQVCHYGRKERGEGIEGRRRSEKRVGIMEEGRGDEKIIMDLQFYRPVEAS